MNILIFLAVLLVAVILAIFLNRLVHCPWLVGFLFFSIALLVAIILSNITLVILAIIVGVVGFLAAFLDCTFNNCSFLKNSGCVNCNNPYETNLTNAGETLSIVNSNGDVIARINGNTIISSQENTDYECNCRRYRRR